MVAPIRNAQMSVRLVTRIDTPCRVDGDSLIFKRGLMNTYLAPYRDLALTRRSRAASQRRARADILSFLSDRIVCILHKEDRLKSTRRICGLSDRLSRVPFHGILIRVYNLIFDYKLHICDLTHGKRGH